MMTTQITAAWETVLLQVKYKNNSKHKETETLPVFSRNASQRDYLYKTIASHSCLQRNSFNNLVEKETQTHRPATPQFNLTISH